MFSYFQRCVVFVVAFCLFPLLSVPAYALEPFPDSDVQIESVEDIPTVDTAVDHILGRRQAEITLIEYGDFECPACQIQMRYMKALVLRSQRRLNVVYRHYPLSYHAHSFEAAEASECVAGDAGNTAFWLFAEAIAQQRQDKFDVTKAIQASGANPGSVARCMSEHRFLPLIQRQAKESEALVQTLGGVPSNLVLVNTAVGPWVYMTLTTFSFRSAAAILDDYFYPKK